MSDDVTIGELGRAMGRLEASQRLQTEKLDDILVQTTKTNGRVDVLEREMRDIKRQRAHGQHRVTDKGDAITVTIPAGALNPKTIVLIISAVISGLVAAWKAGMFS